MITALTNKKVKNLVTLLKKAKARREQDVFVTEGYKMFLEAPPERICKVYLSASFLDKMEGRKEDVMHKLERVGYEVLSDEVFQKVSDTQTPQGILCVVRQHHYSLDRMLQEKNPLLLVLEDIQDPGNLGTMVRTAEGAGVHGIIMSKNTVDIYNPKTIRSTMGSVYRLPFLYTEDLSSVIEGLKEKKITVYAAHLEGKAFYHHMDFRGGTAFLIGNEGNGLKKEIAAQADLYMKIPMAGQVESLNAAVAAVILMYEAARQRRQPLFTDK